MAPKEIAVFASFIDRIAAEKGMDALRRIRLPADRVSVLLPENVGSLDLAEGTKATKGFAAGAGLGAFLGGTFGLLAGAGILGIPGLGPIIAAGPIASALAGMATGGAVGGLAGVVVGMGIPEKEANLYIERLREGRILLSAQCQSDDEAHRVQEALRAAGAEDITSTAYAGRSVRSASTSPSG